MLFTQTMSSLLSASLPLQSALSICSEILNGRQERKFIRKILKGVNEGNRLGDVLSEFGGMFSPLYIALVSIGEESGNLAKVFERLSAYMKASRKMKQKMVQSLAYPMLVLATAVLVVFVLVLFVMPRLEGIFMAFSESSQQIVVKLEEMKSNLTFFAVLLGVLLLSSIVLFLVHRLSEEAAYFIDSMAIRIPVVGNVCKALQIHDFSFAMKILSDAHFPLVDSLVQAAEVVSNAALRRALLKIGESVSDGDDIGECFERNRVFPRYLSVWMKVAEKNGDAARAFNEIYEYYSMECENLLSGVSEFAEPIFILLTGGVIVLVIGQFVIPVFNLLGAL